MTTLDQADVYCARQTAAPTNISLPSAIDTDAQAPTKPNHRRGRAMTWEKLIEKVQLGQGQGHGANYQPWLKIRRKNPSPHSNQVVAFFPTLGRSAHFFSRGEYHFALLLMWLDVIDLREQYPLWPLRHPHPLVGTEDTSDLALPWSRGLLDIAAEAGIKHGVEPGTKLPYVATMDFMATFPTKNGPRCKAFSLKPYDDADDAIKWRTSERLELERRYTHELNIPYNIISAGFVPLPFAGLLELLSDCATLDSDQDLLSIAESFAETVTRHPHVSITEAVSEASTRFDLDIQRAWRLFRHCAWTTRIDIDPTSPIVVTHPCRTGGRALREQLRASLFDGAWK